MFGVHPRFRVRLVEAYGRDGFLIEKRIRGVRECMYFYEPERGLEPGPEIRRACAGHVYLLNGQKDQRLILKELRAYTVAAHASGRMHERRPPVAATEYRDGYADVLGEFFRRGDPVLRAFLGSKSDFRNYILDDVRGGDAVVGQAVEFRVVGPDGVFPEDRFVHLRCHEDFLEGSNESSEWFRRRGPLAIDFAKDVVYRRADLLSALEEHIAHNELSLLEGDMAAGKTVLVRQFAYERAIHRGEPVYYFQCRRSCPHDLANEICSAVGLVIIDDIHLDPIGFQELLTRIRVDCQAKVLFTARPSYQEGSSSRWRRFEDLPALRIQSKQDIDAIIEHYAARNAEPSVSWSAQARHNIKRVAGDDLWLLAHALRGYTCDGDDSSPQNWIGAGVRRELREIAAAGPDGVSQRFPEVLVALSALYRKGDWTSEKYLVRRIGFDRTILDPLLLRGEIRKDYLDGHVMYGLPHMSLARAYWTHGEEYRALLPAPTLARFVPDYALFDTPNGWGALVTLRDPKRNLRRVPHSDILDITRRERNLCDVTRGLRICYWKGLDAAPFVEVIAHKINSVEDARGVFDCLKEFRIWDSDAFELLLERLDWDHFAQRASDTVSLYEMEYFFQMFNRWRRAAERFCTSLDLATLSHRLREWHGGVSGMLTFLSWMHSCSESRADELARKLDIRSLASRLKEDYRASAWCAETAFRLGREHGVAFTADMEWKRYAAHLVSTRGFSDAPPILKAFVSADLDIAMKLWSEVDGGALAYRCNECSHILQLGQVLWATAPLEESDPRYMAHLNWRALAKKVVAADVDEFFWGPDGALDLTETQTLDGLASEMMQWCDTFNYDYLYVVMLQWLFSDSEATLKDVRACTGRVENAVETRRGWHIEHRECVRRLLSLRKMRVAHFDPHDQGEGRASSCGA